MFKNKGIQKALQTGREQGMASGIIMTITAATVVLERRGSTTEEIQQIVEESRIEMERQHEARA